MGRSHSKGVLKRFKNAESHLDRGYWDDAFREVVYKHDHDTPLPGEQGFGDVKGEFDVLLVNYDDKLAMYEEIKTNWGDLYKAENRVERAEKHFEDTEWDLISQTVLE